MGLWAHEAMRLFHDRLVEEEEKFWCRDCIIGVARKWFGRDANVEGLDPGGVYSDWLSRDYKLVDKETLFDFVSARLKVFQEEELDVELVVFDEVLEHVLRIDRVLKQPMGHCLLVGDSGSGKNVLSKFVAWMNGLSIFEIKAHSKYGIEDFCCDLRVSDGGGGGENV